MAAAFFTSVNPIKILTLRTNINVYTYNPTPYAQYAYYFTNTATKVQYNIFLSASVNFNSGLIAELFALENSPRYTLQGSSPSFSILGLGVRKQIMKKKASIGLNTLEPFQKYKYFDSNSSSPGFSQSSHFGFPFRSVGVTFSYSFGKLSFSNPDQKKGVNNDDLKQGDQGVGGGGGTGGGRYNRWWWRRWRRQCALDNVSKTCQIIITNGLCNFIPKLQRPFCLNYFYLALFSS